MIRHENGTLGKRSSNRLCVLVWTENILKTKLLKNYSPNANVAGQLFGARDECMKVRLAGPQCLASPARQVLFRVLLKRKLQVIVAFLSFFGFVWTENT